MAAGIVLYADAAAEVPLKSWSFSHSIAATVTEHAEYRAALDEILATWHVQAILVSSVIGHSLEVLATALPTVVVTHDYFPYCPAINLYFDGICRRCDNERMSECSQANAEFSPFKEFHPAQRAAVRERFMRLVQHANVTIAVPSASVERNLKRLDRRFEGARFATIVHGYGEPLARVDLGDMPAGERLRVLVMGQLSVAKGLKLLQAALPRITHFADVYLLGSREAGEHFKFMPHVHVEREYAIAELPAHVARIRPHAALLTSVVSETFGYALSEVTMLGVPPVATRVGSYPDRIEHGVNGFLYEPDVPGLLAALRAIDLDRGALAKVRANLREAAHRTLEDMVAEYHRLVPLVAAMSGAPPELAEADRLVAQERVTIAGMWNEVRSLHVQLSVANDARHRTEMARLQDAESRRELEARLHRFATEISRREAELLQKEAQVRDLHNQLNFQGAQLAQVFSSTSWRVSSPVRWVGHALPRLRSLLRIAAKGVRDPRGAAARARSIASAWSSGGWQEARRTAGVMHRAETNADSWREYRERFAREVRPRLVNRLGRLARRPLVSIVVPTYNTSEEMLRAMIESVRAQIYPDWELCMVDDGSSDSHVAAVLREFAALDPRIKVDIATDNRGVSSASNKALAMATGEFTVLVDHDDLLEEQALFRMAETVVEDDPDIAYSDEVLTLPDGEGVVRYAHRPAFSPEYLRSHPYIVHLTGYRTRLLREVGGWDETLRISQDYDLLLRAIERARKVVHIPEVLYRWRIHGGSSGIAQQEKVMETSKGILRRHLERESQPGTIEDGASFNFFSVRYPLRPGLKVAVVIPTKNHGDILRQCIASIRATASGVDYDLVVVDHESDDPATREYLCAIAKDVRVLRYQGPFNFAAINNWAVAELSGAYSHYLLCNNDIEAREAGWLERMLELGQQPDIGIVGAMLFYPDGKTIQHAGVGVGLYRGAEHYGKFLRYPEETARTGRELITLSHEVSAVTAACMLVSREAWDAVGGFDEAIAVGFGDVDLCLRVFQKGWRVVYCPWARLIHHESLTRGVSEADPHPVDTALFRMKWRNFLDLGDPYYNPGLSRHSTAWEVLNPIPAVADVRRRVASLASDGGRWSIAHSAPPKAHDR